MIAAEDNNIISENKIQLNTIKKILPPNSDTIALPNSTLVINNTHNQEFNNLNLSFQYLHIVNSSNLIFNNIIASNVRIESPLIQIDFSKNIIINNSLVDNLEIGLYYPHLSMFYTSYSDNIRLENSMIKNIHHTDNRTLNFSLIHFENSNAVIIKNNIFSEFNILALSREYFDSRFKLISMINLTSTIIINNEFTKFNLVEGGTFRESNTIFIELRGRNITVSNNIIHSNYIGFRESSFISTNYYTSGIYILDNQIYNNTHASITYIQSTTNASNITGNIIQNNHFISKMDINNQAIRGYRKVTFINLLRDANETLEEVDRYTIVANNVIRNIGYIANYHHFRFYQGEFYEFPLSYTYMVYNNTFDNIYPLDDFGYQDHDMDFMKIWNNDSPLVKTLVLNNTFSNIVGGAMGSLNGIFLQFVNEFSGNKLLNITNFLTARAVTWRGIEETSGHNAKFSKNILTLGAARYKRLLHIVTFEGNETSNLLLENNVFSHIDGKGTGITYDLGHDNFILRLQNNTFKGMTDWLVGNIDGDNIDIRCSKNTVNGVFAIGCFAIANPLGSQSGETLRYSALVLIVLAMYFIRRKRKKN